MLLLPEFVDEQAWGWVEEFTCLLSVFSFASWCSQGRPKAGDLGWSGVLLPWRTDGEPGKEQKEDGDRNLCTRTEALRFKHWAPSASWEVSFEGKEFSWSKRSEELGLPPRMLVYYWQWQAKGHCSNFFCERGRRTELGHLFGNLIRIIILMGRGTSSTRGMFVHSFIHSFTPEAMWQAWDARRLSGTKLQPSRSLRSNMGGRK